ncbi:MAG: hypothetical protein ACKO96_21700, partial [Flammeovirgaceae bacterium]
TYNYFTIPFVAKIHLDNKRKIAVSIGGYLSQINTVSATENFYNTLDNSRTSSTFTGRTLVAFNANGGVNTASFIPGLQGFAEYDYGAIIGLSYELTLGKQSGLLFQLVDNFGLANVNKKNFTSIPSPYERNHTVSFLLGYTYQLKEKH